jgi:hypothetical protein
MLWCSAPWNQPTHGRSRHRYNKYALERLTGLVGGTELVLVEGRSKRSAEELVGKSDGNMRVVFAKTVGAAALLALTSTRSFAGFNKHTQLCWLSQAPAALLALTKHPQLCWLYQAPAALLALSSTRSFAGSIKHPQLCWL